MAAAGAGGPRAGFCNSDDGCIQRFAKSPYAKKRCHICTSQFQITTWSAGQPCDIYVVRVVSAFVELGQAVQSVGTSGSWKFQWHRKGIGCSSQLAVWLSTNAYDHAICPSIGAHYGAKVPETAGEEPKRRCNPDRLGVSHFLSISSLFAVCRAHGA